MNRGEETIEGETISRWRIVGAVGLATVVPAWAWMLATDWIASFLDSRSAFPAAMTGASVALLLRGIGSLARWLVLGLGPRFDRLLWGCTFAACLAVAAARQFALHELLFACLSYFGVLVVIWAVSAAAFSVRPRVPRMTLFKLNVADLLLALAAMGILAGASRHLLADLRRVDAYDLPFVLIASSMGSFVVAAVALFVDAGVRIVASGAEATDGRMLVAIGFFFVLVCWGMGLITALVSNEPELATASGFAVAYVTFAAAQDEFLARTIEP